MVTLREFSVLAEYFNLSVPCEPKKVPLFKELAVLFQGYCNNLMRDHPRAALRELRTAMLRIAEFFGKKDSIVVSGEKIEA